MKNHNKNNGAKPDPIIIELENKKMSLQRSMGAKLLKEREKRHMKQQDAVNYFYPIVPDNSSWSRYENGTRAIPHLLVEAIYEKWNVLIFDYKMPSTVSPEIQEHIRALSDYIKDC